MVAALPLGQGARPNVILVMTTNAGADRISRASIGFTMQDHTGDAIEEIKRMFNPEFRNRLDAVIQFDALDLETISYVVDKFLVELETQLDSKKVSIDVDADARLPFMARFLRVFRVLIFTLLR